MLTFFNNWLTKVNMLGRNGDLAASWWHGHHISLASPNNLALSKFIVNWLDQF
jgi:hypothetical protein